MQNDAKLTCALDHATLLVTRDLSTTAVEALFEILGVKSTVWAGAEDLGGSDFKWLDDNSDVSDSAFVNGHVKNNLGDCAIVDDYTCLLKVDGCHEENPFVC